MYFANVSGISDLKSQYRRLAARHHPDRGGSPVLMTAINVEYEDLLAAFKRGSKARTRAPRWDGVERRKRGFQTVLPGQTVFVNGTECEVLEVTHDAFRVVAKGRTRQAWILKHSGMGRYNRAIRASWVKYNRRMR